MPPSNRNNRSRTISLRVSEQEYEALKQLYTAHGARSISEFARTAMQRIIAEPSSGVTLELKVQELDGKVSVLDSEVARLAQLIERENRPRPGAPDDRM